MKPSGVGGAHRFEVACPDDLVIESYLETWSQSLLASASALSRHAEHLSAEVERFLQTVRAA